MEAIEVRDVSLTLGNEKILLNVNVNFEKGKIHGLIGRNGSGKTMLVKCICGFVKPDYGTIIVNNQVVGKNVDFPDGVGIIIEIPGFVPYYSGYKNLELLYRLSGKRDKDRIEEVLRIVGLSEVSDKQVKKYSLGMKQRLGLAQAMLENPDIYILDEPMNGLDDEAVSDIRRILLKLKSEGKTILIVSHNRDDIDFLCDTVHSMNRGIIRKIN